MKMNENPLRDRSPPSRAEMARELLRAVDEEREHVAGKFMTNWREELLPLRLLAEVGAEAEAHDRAARARQVAELAATGRTSRARSRPQLQTPSRRRAETSAAPSEPSPSATTGARAFDPGRASRGAFPGVRPPALHRIVQEAVTNAMRHGAASHIRIALRTDVPQWQLVVEDNGTRVRPLANRAGPEPSHNDLSRGWNRRITARGSKYPAPACRSSAVPAGVLTDTGHPEAASRRR